MRKKILLPLFFFLLPLFSTAQNGIYQCNYRLENSQTVITVSGDTIHVIIGEHIQIKEAYIYSTTNDNSRFDIELNVSTYSEGSYFIMKIGEDYFSPSGEGRQISGNDTVNSISFYSDSIHANEIAETFSVPIKYRKRPESTLSAKFITDKKVYRIGQKVNVKMVLSNNGKIPVWYNKGGENRNETGRCENFNFEVYFNGEKLPDSGKSDCYGGRYITPEIKPGGKDEVNECISNWCKFNKPGIYTIHCSYRLELEYAEPATNHLEYIEHTDKLWNDVVEETITIQVKL
jgi:hypothetical protein